MSNYIRTLSPVEIYGNHIEDSNTGKTIEADQLIRYNREKRRNGINWMEIYLGDAVAYVKKDKSKLFFCEKAVLDDKSVDGFAYTLKNGQQQEFYQLFRKATPGQYYKAVVDVKRRKDDKNNTTEFIGLEYDPDVVDVKPFFLFEKARFYVTNKLDKNFMEIDDFQGTKGYVLRDVEYTETKNLWMKYFMYAFMAISALVTFGVALALGWLVIGFILIIPGVIVGAIAVVILKLVFMILGGIFHEIRKRF